MRIGVWIVLLVVLPAVLSKPALKKKALKKHLSHLLRKIRQNDGNCQELSDAAGEVERHLRELMSAVISTPDTNIDAEFMAEVSRRLFGFDMAHDDEERLAYTCDITEASSVSELKATLDGKNLHQNYLALLYDFLAASVPMMSMTIEDAGPERNLLEALESAGLLSLNPEGAAWAGEAMYGELYGFLASLHEPVPPFHGSNQAKCSHVTNAVEALLRSDPQIQSAEQQWTGVGVQDLRVLICDIIDAADIGFGAIYDVIDDRGIINSIYREGYPIVKTYLTLAIGQLEQYEAMLAMTQNFGGQYPYYSNYPRSLPKLKRDAMAQIPHYANPYAYTSWSGGNDLYGNFGQYGNYGPYDYYPTDEGGDEINPEELISIALRFLRALQNSGLLNLPNDI